MAWDFACGIDVIYIDQMTFMEITVPFAEVFVNTETHQVSFFRNAQTLSAPPISITKTRDEYTFPAGVPDQILLTGSPAYGVPLVNTPYNLVNETLLMEDPMAPVERALMSNPAGTELIYSYQGQVIAPKRKGVALDANGKVIPALVEW